jgi:hypothetical protein
MEPSLTRKERRRTQRKAQRERKRRAVRAWQDAVFQWAYHTVEETLHRMQSGPSVIRHAWRDSEPALREPDLLTDLLEGTSAQGFFYSNDFETYVRLIVKRSEWLRESLVGWFIQEHINFFAEVRNHRRFPKHPHHRDRQVQFVALRIAAKISGCSINSASRLLKQKGVYCADCGRPARLEVGICLHRNAKIGTRGECRDCGACTHPFSKPGDHHCIRCGAELLPLMVLSPGITVARPWCPKCTKPQASPGDPVCSNCGAEFETFPVRPHSRQECRNSTWPCPTHDAILPEYQHGAGLRDEIAPQTSCGNCGS